MASQRRVLRPVIVQLRNAAKARGWTAYRLAQETGQTAQTMQRLLDGDGFPTLDTLEAVARALNLRIVAIQ